MFAGRYHNTGDAEKRTSDPAAISMCGGGAVGVWCFVQGGLTVYLTFDGRNAALWASSERPGQPCR